MLVLCQKQVINLCDQSLHSKGPVPVTHNFHLLGCKFPSPISARRGRFLESLSNDVSFSLQSHPLLNNHSSFKNKTDNSERHKAIYRMTVKKAVKNQHLEILLQSKPVKLHIREQIHIFNNRYRRDSCHQQPIRKLQCISDFLIPFHHCKKELQTAVYNVPFPAH